LAEISIWSAGFCLSFLKDGMGVRATVRTLFFVVIPILLLAALFLHLKFTCRKTMIPPHLVDQVIQTAVIEDVVGDYVELKKSGSSFRGLSPFTNEKTPSFYVLPEKGIFKCFSSGKGGSVVNFLMELEKYSFPEAIKQLAQRYGIEIEEEEVSPEQRAALTERESLIALNSWAQQWFTKQLHESEEGQAIALTYFQSRGFRPDILKKFNVGYCPDQWESMSVAAQDAGYTKERLLALGLSKDKDGRLWDFFKGRVMFPIRDVTGRFIAFGGRTLRNDKQSAKYFNSPESILYHKGDVLFGIHLAKPAIAKEDRVLLVEGYTDVMAMHQAGLEHVVSSSGTALTDGQIKLVRRYTKNVTVLFDGDAAGIRASLRGVDLLLAEGMNVKVVLFPDGDDPDSFSKKVSSEELKRHIAEEAKDFVAFKMELLSQEAGDDPVQRAEMIHSVMESIAAIPDGIQQGVYLKLAAEDLGMPEDTLQLEINKIQRLKLVQEQKAAKRDAFRNRQAGSQTPPPSGVQIPPNWTDEHAPIPEDRAESPETDANQRMALDHRTVLEYDLIRLLILYGKETLFVDIEAEEQEGSESPVAKDADEAPKKPEQLEVSFAELMLHHLEETDVPLQDVGCQKIHAFFQTAIAEGRLPSSLDLLSQPDTSIHQLVTDLTIIKDVVSERWGEVHQIYPAREADQLHKAMMDSMHQLKLNVNRQEILRVQDGLIALSKEVDAGDETAIQGMRELLEKRKQLDAQKREIARYFGSAILP
jgi:DNA primase